jgi:shikimate dehydrogenase
MTNSRPLIVVTLPARTAAAAREEVARARTGGADLAEIRLDRWTPAERGRVGELFPTPLPLIATLRSHAEGGEGPDERPDRAKALGGAAAFPFAYIDLEAARDGGLLDDPRGSDRPVLRSSHFLRGGPPVDLASQLHGGAPGDLRKIVVYATFSEALRDILPALEGRVEPGLLLLTSGPSGPLFRAWARRLGLPLVFASLPEPLGASPGEKVEESQIPVDRLRPFLEVEDGPIFAVVGHPVGHSHSPAIHHRWMAKDGRRGLYIALDLASPEEVRLAVEVLPRRGVRGLNVTHPWKHLAYELAGQRSTDAVASGVGNCLTFGDSGTEVENTDVEAIRRRLEELREDHRWDGTGLVVLGAGGAARATLVAATRLGARARILSRRPESARALADEFDAEIGDRRDPAPTSLVVHATDVGRAGRGSLELPLRDLLRDGTYVLDWVYAPDDPSIARAAAEAGATYEAGERLLVYQAAASYRRWWGDGPDAEAIEEAVGEVACTG